PTWKTDAPTTAEIIPENSSDTRVITPTMFAEDANMGDTLYFCQIVVEETTYTKDTGNWIDDTLTISFGSGAVLTLTKNETGITQAIYTVAERYNKNNLPAGDYGNDTISFTVCDDAPISKTTPDSWNYSFVVLGVNDAPSFDDFEINTQVSSTPLEIRIADLNLTDPDSTDTHEFTAFGGISLEKGGSYIAIENEGIARLSEDGQIIYYIPESDYLKWNFTEGQTVDYDLTVTVTDVQVHHEYADPKTVTRNITFHTAAVYDTPVITSSQSFTLSTRSQSLQTSKRILGQVDINTENVFIYNWSIVGAVTTETGIDVSSYFQLVTESSETTENTPCVNNNCYIAFKSEESRAAFINDVLQEATSLSVTMTIRLADGTSRTDNSTTENVILLILVKQPPMIHTDLIPIPVVNSSEIAPVTTFDFSTIPGLVTDSNDDPDTGNRTGTGWYYFSGVALNMDSSYIVHGETTYTLREVVGSTFDISDAVSITEEGVFSLEIFPNFNFLAADDNLYLAFDMTVTDRDYGTESTALFYVKLLGVNNQPVVIGDINATLDMRNFASETTPSVQLDWQSAFEDPDDHSFVLSTINSIVVTATKNGDIQRIVLDKGCVEITVVEDVQIATFYATGNDLTWLLNDGDTVDVVFPVTVSDGLAESDAANARVKVIGRFDTLRIDNAPDQSVSSRTVSTEEYIRLSKTIDFHLDSNENYTFNVVSVTDAEEQPVSDPETVIKIENVVLNGDGSATVSVYVLKTALEGDAPILGTGRYTVTFGYTNNAEIPDTATDVFTLTVQEKASAIITPVTVDAGTMAETQTNDLTFNIQENIVVTDPDTMDAEHPAGREVSAFTLASRVFLTNITGAYTLEQLGAIENLITDIENNGVITGNTFTYYGNSSIFEFLAEGEQLVLTFNYTITDYTID
ncbi:MAG: hypothetical protein IKW74_03185, partial [Thermoguttaceae bacterium]|nr:hypothetical protein [Thermoguttaceae bacterium]